MVTWNARSIENYEKQKNKNNIIQIITSVYKAGYLFWLSARVSDARKKQLLKNEAIMFYKYFLKEYGQSYCLDY